MKGRESSRGAKGIKENLTKKKGHLKAGGLGLKDGEKEMGAEGIERYFLSKWKGH